MQDFLLNLKNVGTIIHRVPCVLQEVVAINLSNQHGSEGLLGQSFIRENTRFADSTSGLRLVSFDFHKICGSRHYER